MTSLTQQFIRSCNHFFWKYFNHYGSPGQYRIKVLNGYERLSGGGRGDIDWLTEVL